MTVELKYAQLANNQQQKDAVDSSENVVVISGPGSGKTRIATLKASIELLREKKVACISFSRVAAQKMRLEFHSHEVTEDNVIFGTVHSFCLGFVIQRYLHLYQHLLPEPWNLLSRNWHIATPSKIQDIVPSANSFKLKKARYARYDREIYVSNLDMSNLDEYDLTMIKHNLLDFDMIAELSLRLIQIHRNVSKSFERHFDWVIIDEYQDLGTLFHKFIVYLSQNTDVRFMIVGDPDQSIYVDQGGKYISELSEEFGFYPITTKLCYRFSQVVTDKSCLILNKTKDYIADSTVYSKGDINCYIDNNWRETDVANYAINTILSEILSRKQYEKLGEIAILYAQRKNTNLPELIIKQLNNLHLNDSEIAFIDERGIRIPNTPLIEWIQDCADWCFTELRSRSITLDNLVEYYERLHWDAEIPIDEEVILPHFGGH